MNSETVAQRTQNIADRFRTVRQFEVDDVPISLCDIFDYSAIDVPTEGAPDGIHLGNLNPYDISTIAPAVFSQLEPIKESVRAMHGTEEGVERIRVAFLASGLYSTIWLTEVHAAGRSHYLALNVSLWPANSTEGAQVKRDFSALGKLHDSFTSRLKESAARKYRIAKPGAFWESEIHNGLSYPCFTTAFEPYPGIKMGIVQTGSNRSANHFRYTDDFDSLQPGIAQFNARQRKQAAGASKVMEQLKERFGNRPERLNRAVRSQYPWIYEYSRQEMDYLVGCALVYLLSGNRYPHVLPVSGGDWIGTIKSDGLELVLTRIHGGIKGRVLSDKEWMAVVRGGMEMNLELLEKTRFNTVMPFIGVPNDTFEQALATARSLVKS